MECASREGVMDLSNVREVDEAWLQGQALVFRLGGRIGWVGGLFPIRGWWW